MTAIKMRTALLIVILASPVRAGGLGGFEAALGKGSDGGSFAAEAIELFLRVAEAAGGATMEYAAARPAGMPLAPLLRLDAAYQMIPPDIDAISGRVEAGRGPLAAAYERIVFRERDPRDRLFGWRAEALWRLIPGEGFRLDGAAGFMGFRREEDHSGACAGLSIGYYPRRAVGYEADLRWGSIGDATASDLRGRLYLSPRSWRGLALRPGYRALRTGDATLHGPELTVSYTW